LAGLGNVAIAAAGVALDAITAGAGIEGRGGFSTGGVGATGLFFFLVIGFGLPGESSKLFTDWLRFIVVSGVLGSNLMDSQLRINKKSIVL